MSATKSSMLMALVALFLCLSSTVMAAELLEPGNPFNCTIFKTNCKNLGDLTFGNGKNSSYQGIQARCNVTNLSDAKNLCGQNVICTATFLLQVGANPNPPAGSTATTTTTTTTTAGATPTNGTAPPPSSTTKPSTSNGMYTIGSADLTAQLVGQYNTEKCGKNAANAKVATSLAAMIVIASVISFMSSVL
ncbi:hypothetical protein BGX29_005750 [Mortierella sp. GBA35]|nr:hypothetical protein BGX29_005750 [Mortierella sp. GBA35]